MTPEEKAAYIQSQAACALITAMGMQAENSQRLAMGLGIAYSDEAFNQLPARFGIDHNMAMSFLRDQ